MCVYVCNLFLKGQNVLTIPFVFFSLFGVRTKIGEKTDFSCKFTLCQFYLCFFTIVIIINKAFKLFKLVLVVYCDSCCHW